jgi:hypothetical protein
MSLTDLPTVKLSKGKNFLMAASLAVFMYYFTQQKESDLPQPKKSSR